MQCARARLVVPGQAVQRRRRPLLANPSDRQISLCGVFASLILVITQRASSSALLRELLPRSRHAKYSYRLLRGL